MLSKKTLAIEVLDIAKCFQIYKQPSDRLKQFFVSLLNNKAGCHYSKSYEEFWALKDVSFDVFKGETVGIIGRNGSGKSTLLQLICGTLNPTSGSINVSGRVAALLELGAGFNPEFSGLDNIFLNASILGLSRQEIDQRLRDIIDFADIGNFIEQPVKNYSSGMYVRLAFSIAINVSPDILIVDEALAVGDVRFQAKCLRKINEIRDAGSTVIFVSHSSAHIEALCDRVIWLNDGCIKKMGTPKQIMRSYLNFMVHGLDDELSEANSHTANVSSGSNLVSSWMIPLPSLNIKKEADVRLQRFRFSVGEELNPLRLLSESYEFEFEFDVYFGLPVVEPLIGFGIFNALNEPVIHFNTYNTRSVFSPVHNEQIIRYHIAFDLPALKPGEYLVSIGVDDGVPGANNILLHVYDLWTFSVRPKYGVEQGGYVQIQNLEFTCEEVD